MAPWAVRNSGQGPKLRYPISAARLNSRSRRPEVDPLSRSQLRAAALGTPGPDGLFCFRIPAAIANAGDGGRKSRVI